MSQTQGPPRASTVARLVLAAFFLLARAPVRLDAATNAFAVADAGATDAGATDAGATDADATSNKNLFASSQLNKNFSKWRATDNNIASGWAPSQRDRSPWLEVDLASATNISTIEMVTSQGSDQPATRRDFEIAVSNSKSFASRTVLCSVGSKEIAHKSTYVCAANGAAYRYVFAAKPKGGPFYVAELRVLRSRSVAPSISPALSTSPPTGPISSATTIVSQFTKPPFPARMDYQLGGAYPPATDVGIVTRDRNDLAAGRYDICYVNGFQAQADELGWWQENHPDLLLKNANGAAVIDQTWNEAILDISTQVKREQLSSVIEGWVRGCKTNGFEAVEFDNLDTYTRFPTYLTEANALDMANRLIMISHDAGLAVGQKNSVELTLKRPPFDFAVVESCSKYDECQGYFDAYGNNVLMIEYNATSFSKACTQFPQRTVLYADQNLVPKGSAGYRRQYC